MNLVVIAFAFELAYHTVRCARAAGYKVYVLGADTASGFKYSFACTGYSDFPYRPDKDPIDVAITKISEYIRAVGAEAVIPADILSTRLLIAIADRLPVKTCLLPKATVFDELNDKWQFSAICRQAGVRIPETSLRANYEEAVRDVRNGQLKLPLVVKPVLGMAGSGVHIIREELDLEKMPAKSDTQVLVQPFVLGRDRDISIVAQSGKLIAYAVQFRTGGHIDFSDSPQLREMIEKLIAFSGFEGVAHFDAVEQAESGDFYLIECNPRFWYSIFALNAAGSNFVALSLDRDLRGGGSPSSVGPVLIPTGKTVIRDFLRLYWTRELFFMIYYYLTDIPGTIADIWKLFDDERPGRGGIDDQLAQLRTLQQSTFPATD